MNIKIKGKINSAYFTGSVIIDGEVVDFYHVPFDLILEQVNNVIKDGDLKLEIII